MEALTADESYAVVDEGGDTIVVRGTRDLVRYFAERGVISRHRGRYWKRKLTKEATMVFTTETQVAWYLVRSMKARPLGAKWDAVFRQEPDV